MLNKFLLSVSIAFCATFLLAAKLEGQESSRRSVPIRNASMPQLVNPEQFRATTVLPSARRQDGVRSQDDQSSLSYVLPEPTLDGGIVADPMQRSTYQRRIADPNLSYVASASFAPMTRVVGVGYLKTWDSPNLAHRPLMFEDENLERYGNSRGRMQPVYSGVHFFGSIAALPYKTAITPPRDCVYSLGYYRPGDCNPAYKPTFTWSRQGFFRQALTVGGILAGL